MVFNSVVFLFCFLPLALLAYYLVPGRGKNVVLLVESLLFYCWTGVEYLPLIVCLIVFNYLWGLLTARTKAKLKGLLPAVAVLGIVNTGLACYLYFSSIQVLPAQSVSICGYLDPLSALFFSALFLKERLTVAQLVGALLILGGAAVAEGL